MANDHSTFGFDPPGYNVTEYQDKFSGILTASTDLTPGLIMQLPVDPTFTSRSIYHHVNFSTIAAHSYHDYPAQIKLWLNGSVKAILPCASSADPVAGSPRDIKNRSNIFVNFQGSGADSIFFCPGVQAPSGFSAGDASGNFACSPRVFQGNIDLITYEIFEPTFDVNKVWIFIACLSR